VCSAFFWWLYGVRFCGAPAAGKGLKGVGSGSLIISRLSFRLLSESDWSAIQETLYLLSVPGMRESIKEGLATSIDECDRELVW
jgi:hypothetical protein